MESQIGSLFDILLERTEQLIVNDSVGFADVIFKPNGNDYPLLKCLGIGGNSKMSYLMGNDFTSLEWLGLGRMMMLESLVPRDVTTNPFKKLKVIQIGTCEQLRNIFSFFIFEGLSNLQKIEVNYCNTMDEIVSVEIEDQNAIFESPLTTLHLEGLQKLTSFCTKPFIQQSPQTMIPFFDQRVSFPKLKYLSITRGDNLEMLWHNNGLIGSSFSQLVAIIIKGCNRLRCILPSNIVTALVCLDTLDIVGCELLERVFEIENPIFCDKKVVPLTFLRLRSLPNLKYVWSKDVNDVLAFPNLKNVDVTDCPKLRSIFPASFTKYFEQIESLTVDEQNEIFPVDEASELGQVVLFRSLRTFTMSCKLAMKESFWRISKFLQLESLTLIGSEDDKMITLPLKMTEVLYQRCANLKNLELRNLPKLMQVWNNINQMTTIKFFNLVDLEVYDCDGMINLFNLKNLVNLNSIKIFCCKGMTSIVAVEGEGEEEKSEIIIFIKLTEVYLRNLPTLASFYSGKCRLKFPLLKMLDIEECNEMETFSNGIDDKVSVLPAPDPKPFFTHKK
ncbi:uncharacterized protein LOC120087922 isoform X2 [Benincasa hispida]|uniref:uncharacterized protein LOC120087922 isoform X2 n=1 Tax=Benincasa hispida TaxID=102211 RepID=UPI0019013391|nr:uncharacterized protein LOC120087922 isoform X2 [Benincasa hispida]